MTKSWNTLQSTTYYLNDSPPTDQTTLRKRYYRRFQRLATFWRRRCINNSTSTSPLTQHNAAFDTLDHAIFLERLEFHCRVATNHWNGLLLSLKKKTRFIHLGTHVSTLLPVPYDFPQKYVLGALLFLFYVSKLPAVTGVTIDQFSDNTQESTSSRPLVALNSRLPSTPSSPGQGMHTTCTSITESSSIHSTRPIHLKAHNRYQHKTTGIQTIHCPSSATTFFNWQYTCCAV